MEWTEQQKDAIERRGSDILVSAAAGSGKTAVLTERIKRLITQDKISIDRMLIVTFSNAAAAEMKEKIIKSLSKAVSEYEEENPERTGEQRAFKNYLKDQIRLARTADISTFHKFSMNVIRRYFYNTDIEPDFGICDEGRRQILIEETLEELFEERFRGKKNDYDFDNGGSEDTDVKEFTEFLRRYSDVKSETAVKEMILSAYRFIMSMPDPFEWLDEAVEKLNLDTESFKQQDPYKIMRKDTMNDIEQACSLCALVYDEVCGLPSIEPKAKQDLENIERIVEAVRRGEETAGLNMEFQRFAAKKDDKEEYNIIKEKVKHQRDKAKDIVKKILGEASAVSLEDEIGRINGTYEPAVYLTKLVKDFHERFTAKKKERSLLDFNDIEHAALDILKDEEIAEEYRKHFEVIFIDEYQDSSILQETLIRRISRGNNVYMVGDVKQSIYKFRLAEPEIFINKYNDFKSGGRGARIDLNRNFRSKGNIINCINAIFENIMNKDTCGIDYDEAASLTKGCSYEGELDRKVSLHLVDGSTDDEAEDIDDELAELKNTQLEALVVAGLVKERIGQEIYDQKKEEIRKTELGDIVILLRSTRGKSDIYAKALKEAGIPSYVDAGEGYFETTEIEVFMNLLRVIDNKRRDVPLLSVLRSPIFGFSIDELIKIRLAYRDGSYNEAFLRYAGLDSDNGGEMCSADSNNDSEHGEIGEEGVQETIFGQAAEKADMPYTDDGLSEKCLNVCGLLDRWRKEVRYMPLENFLWKLIRETGYMEYVSALKNGDVRAANLRALVDKAVDFTASHMKGLFGFITYAEAVSRNNVPIGQVMQAGSSENAVRIMTIHKSKGLEFPVVILAGLGSRFNRDRNTSRIIFHKDLGIGLRYSDPENNMYASTLTQRIIGRQRDRERIAEEMRILYVAMTRAMDELVMVGTINNLESNLEKYEIGTKGGAHDASGFLDWIIPYFNEKIYTHSRGSLSQTVREDEEKSVNLENEIREDFPSFKDINGILNELGRRFDFEYDYGDDVFSKSKFTVSGINRMIREAQERLVSPKQRFTVQEIDDALQGNIIKDRNTEILHGGEPEWQTEPAGGAVEESEDYPIPEFLKEDTDITPAMRGTLTHKVIELIPFNEEIAESSVEQFIRDFVHRGLLTEKEASVVNCGKVAAFFGSELGRRASRAEWLKKEWAFTLRKKRQEVAAMAESREVKAELEQELPPELLIQGIIDCCFKDEKGIVLIDFKTDYVDYKNRQASIEKLRSRYRNQLVLYAEVVEKALDEPVGEKVLFLLDSGDAVSV